MKVIDSYPIKAHIEYNNVLRCEIDNSFREYVCKIDKCFYRTFEKGLCDILSKYESKPINDKTIISIRNDINDHITKHIV